MMILEFIINHPILLLVLFIIGMEIIKAPTLKEYTMQNLQIGDEIETKEELKCSDETTIPENTIGKVVEIISHDRVYVEFKLANEEPAKVVVLNSNCKLFTTELQRLRAQVKQAKEQRLIALIQAFKTIDAFAIPSLSPDQYEKLDEVKGVLLERYSNDVDMEELKKLEA